MHAEWMQYANPYAGLIKPRVRTRARYDFIEFVRPDCYHTYTIEQQFGVFRWMARTASHIEQGGCVGPYSLLNASSAHHYSLQPVYTLDGLTKRFHYVLLARNSSVMAERWKVENGISINARKWIIFPHYEPFSGTPIQGEVVSESKVRDALNGLLCNQGRLKVQLNQFHPDATEIYGVEVRVDDAGFSFHLSYGYDGSGWKELLASTTGGETFTDTMDRAITRIKELEA